MQLFHCTSEITRKDKEPVEPRTTNQGIVNVPGMVGIQAEKDLFLGAMSSFNMDQCGGTPTALQGIEEV